MFQLLQPIWLFALAGLSVPVIIHLWNKKPGKTLKVGSIALVKENALAYQRKIRLYEWLLLLLRCLLLACVITALAGPVSRSERKDTVKGWILMSRQELPLTYKRFKPAIDSLLAAGYEFHYFEDGFTSDKLTNALQLPAATAFTQVSYRNIIALLNEEVPARLPVYIFTDNYLRHFNGKRSTVSLNLHWFTYTPDTTAAKFPVDTAALHVTVFSKNYTNDAHYLNAALEAIRQFSKRNIITQFTSIEDDIQDAQDWLFWLQDTPPANMKNARHVFLYTPGKEVNQTSYILPVDESSFAGIDLYKLVTEPDSTKHLLKKCWQDGFGHAVLAVEQQKKTAWYYFYSHFDPSWNGLPWSDNFPAILYKLLYEQTAGRNTITDNTIIDDSQLAPILIPSNQAITKPVQIKETKLSSLFWMSAFILFFAERCLSYYQRKTK